MIPVTLVLRRILCLKHWLNQYYRTGTDCVLCCEPLNDNEVSCQKCESICHLFCLSALNSDLCQTCAATDDILTQQSQGQNPQSQEQSSVKSSNVGSLSNIESALKTSSRINQTDENEKLANEIKRV